MRTALAASALAVLGLAAAPAVADTPKQGYYIDPSSQVYVIVTKDRKAIKSFQGNCNFKTATGDPTSSGSLYTGKATRIKIGPSGSFSYSGTLLLPSGSGGPATRVKGKVTGSFKNGKAKGTYEVTTAGVACEKTTFSGRYYGVNPKG